MQIIPALNDGWQRLKTFCRFLRDKYHLNSPEVKRFAAGWLDKFSVAGAAVGVFQGQTSGLLSAVGCFGLGVALTLSLRKEQK